VAASDRLRDEIVKYVVEPCYLDAVMRNRVEGVADQQMLELLKIMQSDETEKMVNALLPVISKAKSAQERLVIYEIGKQTCIQAARGAQ